MKSNHLVVLSCLVFFVALPSCSGAQGNDNAVTPSPILTPTPSPVVSTAPTFEQSVSALEASGDLPVLDRSNSLPGPDRNINGIRDDIDEFILKKGYSAAEKIAIERLAKVFQSEVTVVLSNADELRRVSSESSLAVTCLSVRFPSQFMQLVDLYEQVTVNTPERYNAYAAYNEKQSGSVSVLPPEANCQ